MRTCIQTQQGSVLIIAVIAMLILSVLGVSFALLSKIETTIGFNYRQQAQAEAMAEAALDRARDELRGAATATDGFSAWLNGTAPNVSGHKLWNATAQTPPIYAGSSNYWYMARVDNDCHQLNTVPQVIDESAATCAAGTNNTVDTNDTAVVTTWAQAGSGRSRVRGILAIDNVWRHVCSDHKADNGGYCNDDANRNGNPSVQPSDANDPNGPAAWSDLPRPYMGCSRIDHTIHGATAAQCNPVTGTYGQMYQAPYPSGAGVPRMVIMGADPAVVAGAKTCNPTGNKAYFGYFDCALATPCDATATNCNGSTRMGCLDASDPTDITVAPYVGKYWKVSKDPSTGEILTGTGCVAHGATGMVFVNQPMPDQNWGDQGHRFTYYLLNMTGGGTLSLQNHDVYGTVVIEGDHGNGDDLQVRTRAHMWTGPSDGITTGWGAEQYGYPLAVLIWDPQQAMPATPPSLPTSSGTPQNTTADMGSAGGGASDRSQVHGMVYSGGHVEFNPMVLDGSVIAWEIQTQATNSSYSYNYNYGKDAPPPGFPKGTGTEVKVIRKSFIVCANYSDETSAATACQ